MEKKNIVKLLDELFLPIGFKRKGNYWVNNGEQVSKVVDLQKSNYSNSYYINFGYNLNRPAMGRLNKHISYRLAGNDKSNQTRLNELLDMESEIIDEIRLNELKNMISEQIVAQFQLVNSDADIFSYLKRRPHLYDIPLRIKEYFGIE